MIDFVFRKSRSYGSERQASIHENSRLGKTWDFQNFESRDVIHNTIAHQGCWTEFSHRKRFSNLSPNSRIPAPKEHFQGQYHDVRSNPSAEKELMRSTMKNPQHRCHQRVQPQATCRHKNTMNTLMKQIGAFLDLGTLAKLGHQGLRMKIHAINWSHSSAG